MCIRDRKYTVCDFCSYLNGFSVQKWKEYTNIGKVSLELEVEGEFELIFSGYHLVQLAAQKHIFFKKRFSCSSRQVIEIEIPETKETLIGFEIQTFSDCRIFNGGYFAEVDDDVYKRQLVSYGNI